MIASEDTIAALATPPAEGGLGVIRVSGPSAVVLVGSLFRSASGADLRSVPTHTCHLGTIVGDADIDQAVASVFRAPHSYTGEDIVEISAHGSPFILQQILALCLRRGARLAGPGEFTQRAFLHGKIDLTQAEAVCELIRSRSDQTHRAALAQLQGRLAEEVRRLRGALMPLVAHIEVGLDHSDENHEFLPREELQARCREVRGSIASILESARVGKILREGVRVALVGRPNVGKSSLLNALLKEERAIVTPIAGTTRDTLEEAVRWDGMPVTLIDTAGLRESPDDPVETLGIARTQDAIQKADIVLGLFDGSQALDEEDRRVVELCRAKPHCWVVSKSDLNRKLDADQFHHWNGDAPLIAVSALTGDGLPALVERTKALALNGAVPNDHVEWLLNTRHDAALRRADASLERAVRSADNDAYEECVALELQTALGALGEIIGETTTEDLLDQIFSTFCVGK